MHGFSEEGARHRRLPLQSHQNRNEKPADASVAVGDRMDVLEHPVRQQLTQQLGRPGIGGECKLSPVAHRIGKRRRACVTEEAFGEFRIPDEIRKRLELACSCGNHPVPGVLEQPSVYSQNELLDAVAGALLKGVGNRSNDGCVVHVGRYPQAGFIFHQVGEGGRRAFRSRGMYGIQPGKQATDGRVAIPGSQPPVEFADGSHGWIEQIMNLIQGRE